MGFSTYHPAVNFIYFVIMVVFAMFFMYPACLIVSVVSVFLYMAVLNGKKVWKTLVYAIPLTLFMAILNPAFNHRGTTILCYLPGGNPLTWESIVYGVMAAVMFISVICWFSCYHRVMTSDKFLYLFGRMIPSLALLFSMVLRFVPRFTAQWKIVYESQRYMGRSSEKESVIGKISNYAAMLSSIITWSLENAVDTADSMKARGYGLTGRTHFSIFRFCMRDALLLGAITGLTTVITAGALGGALEMIYFPSIRMAEFSAWTVLCLICYAVLCLLPVLLYLVEEMKWNYIK